MILILKLNLTSLSTTHVLMYLFLNEVKFNLRIKLSCLHKFLLSYNYMSSLRTTTCDTLIVPSGIHYTNVQSPNSVYLISLIYILAMITFVSLHHSHISCIIFTYIFILAPLRSCDFHWYFYIAVCILWVCV